MSSSGTFTPPYAPSPVTVAAEVAAAAGGSGASAATAAAPELRLFKTFDEMGIAEPLLRGVYAFGWEKPSDIQQKAIVPIMEGRDVLAQAQSGTGKTGTFVIGGLSRIDTSRNEVQMVVISPVRELADQTFKVARDVGTYMGLRCHLATGGPPVSEDLAVLESRGGEPRVPHFLSVTPGRFYDLLNRRAVNPSTIRVLVLDEADQMLAARFRQQIECILKMRWPESTQVALLSATMIDEIRRTAASLLRDPVEILLDPDEVTLEGIKQWYVKMDRDEEKLDTLCDLYDSLSISQANIFVNTKPMAQWLAEQMRRRGFDLDYIHGEMEAGERQRRMDDFRHGKVRVLISTDLLGRGIDVQQISIVINYELPLDRENYIHRIGRSARYGRKGASINLVTPREMRAQAEIEAFYGKKVNELPIDLSTIW
jgi:superfamily II DNA/RNA helicase